MILAGNKYYLKSVGNALGVLELFNNYRKPLTIAEIVGLSALDRATVNRIVYTLHKDGYLVKRDKKYALSYIFLQFGNAFLQCSDIMQSICNEMKMLSEKYGETTFVFAERNLKNILIDYYEPKGAGYARNQMGENLPYNCSAIGKVFLSRYDDRTISAIMAENGFFRSTEKSICTLEALLEEVHFVQQHGYATCVGEYMLETGALAVPVYDDLGNIAYAISLCYGSSMTSARLQKIIPELLAMNKRLSTQCGYKNFPHR